MFMVRKSPEEVAGEIHMELRSGRVGALRDVRNMLLI